MLTALPAARPRRPGGRRAGRSLPPTLTATAGLLLALSGCHSDQNAARAYDCSKDSEYQPSSTACHSGRASQAPRVARVQARPAERAGRRRPAVRAGRRPAGRRH